MATQPLGPKAKDTVSARHSCWVVSLVLALGIPGGIWIVSKLITASLTAAIHGSPEQRFFLWFSAGLIVEWLFVLGLWFVLRRRRTSFAAMGVWRLGTWPAWALALSFAALSIASNLRLFPRMGIPIASAFFPHGFHLFAALVIGITAGFCEEVFVPWISDDTVCGSRLRKGDAGAHAGRCFRTCARRLFESRSARVARNRCANSIPRNDVGSSISVGSPQPSADDGCSLSE
jgi:hypothetical protein